MSVAGTLAGGEVLHSLVSSDNVTSHQQWMELVRRLQADGHGELGIQLLAVVTVATSMQQALNSLQDKMELLADA